MDNRPIGIFDSGVGGLSVWRELVDQLPNESVLYYADSLNCPYGNKPLSEIKELSENIVKFLLEQEAKLIIVACNTATAAAIDYLRDHYPIPFVGMEPAIKPAAINTRTGSIAILATEGTFNGRLFNETKSKYAKNIDVSIIVGEGLVEIVEENKIHKENSKQTINQLLKPVITKDIDHLVLGCTHYPFLIKQFTDVVGENVKIVNPAPAVVKQTKRILDEFNLNANLSNLPQYNFWSSGDKKILNSLLSEITDHNYSVL